MNSKIVDEAIAGNILQVEALLKSGVNPNKEVGAYGLTPLMGAVMRGNLEVARLLLDFGADVNAIDEHDKTPLDYACLRGDESMSDMLLAHSGVGAKQVHAVERLISGENDSEGNGEAAGAEEEETIDADYNPVLNNFRYLVMRLARLIMTMLCELGAFASVVGAAFAAFSCFMHIINVDKRPAEVLARLALGSNPSWCREALYYHPYILFVFFVTLGIALLGTSLATGILYRFKATMPGPGVVVCGSCHKVTPEDWTCHECKGSRFPERLATALLYGANCLVTVLWVVHDLTLGLIACNYFGGRE